MKISPTAACMMRRSEEAQTKAESKVSPNGNENGLSQSYRVDAQLWARAAEAFELLRVLRADGMVFSSNTAKITVSGAVVSDAMDKKFRRMWKAGTFNS